MSTYSNVKTVEQAEKFWIAREGVVGTAHKSRSGEWVDFRPAARRQMYHDRTHLLAGPKAWVVEYYPAKGVAVQRAVTVYRHATGVTYGWRDGRVAATSVAYGWRDGRVAATVTVADVVSSDIVMDAPESVTFAYPGEVDGWPLPAEMQAEIAAAEAAREASWQAYTAARAAGVDAAVREWAEGLPAGSQERRWMQRWLRTGKAQEQVFAAAAAAEPGKYQGMEKALFAFKKEVMGE